VLRSRLYTASLAALSGLVFALIEACVYVFVYADMLDIEDMRAFTAYRFSVPLVMHTVASFIFGLGISRGVIDWANGVGRFPRDSRNFFIAAMVLHAGFNLVVVSLEISGVIGFD
jgi:RsiW-degrading membrane proteinase PrsW (M82 family)